MPEAVLYHHPALFGGHFPALFGNAVWYCNLKSNQTPFRAPNPPITSYIYNVSYKN